MQTVLPPFHLRAPVFSLPPPLPQLPIPRIITPSSSFVLRPTEPPCCISFLDCQKHEELDLCSIIGLVESLRMAFHPAIFKFGITRDITFRHFNNRYGYFLQGWRFMQALHVGTPEVACHVERILISHYGERGFNVKGCHNIAPGGEKPPPSPMDTFSYVVFSNCAFDIIGLPRTRIARSMDPRIMPFELGNLTAEEIPDDTDADDAVVD
jgi:hypothetical protein